MKRRPPIMTILVFLLLGAIVNVAVAMKKTSTSPKVQTSKLDEVKAA